jgi:hypothetical protein
MINNKISVLGRILENKITWKFPFYIVAISIISLVALIPWYPDLIQVASGDDAFAYIYHEVLSGKAQCGNDLYCHHGQLGAWYWPMYHPETYWRLIFSHIYVAGVIIVVMSSIIFDKTQLYLHRVFFILPIIALLSIDLDARIFLSNIIFLIVLPKYIDRKESLLPLLLLSVISFSFFVKSTFIIIGIVSVVVSSIIEIISHRRIPKILLWYVLFLVIFSTISGMSIFSIPQHIDRTFSFATGYSAIFSEYGNFYEIIVFFVFSLIFISLVVKSKKYDQFWIKWIYIVGYAVILFIIYKAAFTRADGQHIMHGYVSMIISIVVYAIANFNIFINYDAIYNNKISYIVVLFLALLILIFLYKNPTIYQGKFEKLYVNSSTAFNVIFADNKLPKLHEMAMDKISDEYPIEDIEGSVMLWDDRQTIGIANNLNLQFLPTITSSIVTNKSSEFLNSQSFSAIKIPDYLLVGSGSRFPGRSTLEIIKNYSFDRYNNSFIQLKNTSKIQKNTIFSAVSEFNINLNEKLKISSTNNMIWSSIKVDKTILGKIVELVYKIPKLYIEVERVDGSKSSMVSSSELLEDGFILSYVGESMHEIFNDNIYYIKNPIRSLALKSKTGFWPFYNQNVIVNTSIIEVN